jgi:teichuronic acid biosynthesis glycosyltransferase TuaC
MKVLSILAATSNPLGMVFTHRQIASLEKLGIENLSFYLPAKGLSVIKVFRCFREFRKTIRSFEPDMIHAQYGMVYAFFAAFTNLHPLIITFHGSDLNTIPGESIYRSYFKKFLSNIAILRAQQVICVSPLMKANIWWRKKSINVIPLGIDTEEFRPMEKTAARKQLKWDTTEFVILFNANNPVVKRLDIAEQTIEIVRRRFSKARLEVLDGKKDNREIVPILLNASDCLLICSDSEGSPTMVKEAMACNVPVVGVNVGDVKERLEGVITSLVVGKDPASLAEGIVHILRSNRKSNGREKLINDGLTEDVVAKRILSVYERAIKKATNR